MSRIGKKPIKVPENVKVEIENGKIAITGTKGLLEFMYRPEISVELSGDEIIVKKAGNSKKAPAFWGTTARIIEGMIEGVTEGFEKQLELNGVGFRMALQGKKIDMALGFSHPVKVNIPEGIEVKIEGNILTVSGINKQKVGQFAAEIRSLKPAEPYKGKGFKYAGEAIIRKEKKKTAVAE